MLHFSIFRYLNVFFLCFIFSSQAQFNFPDTIMVCNTNLVNIEMDMDTSTVNLLANIQSTQFNTLNLGDDSFSDTIDIGFNFTFYGYPYSHCILSSNNYISFDTSFASLIAPYTISNALPDTSNNINANKLKNTILAPWQDIQPNIGGLLDYATVGTAPNRIFVVRWFDVPMYQCVTSYYSSAILLYENGNKIETHIVNKPNCNWNNGLAIHGLQNKTGSIAELVIDPINGLERNYPNTWSTTTEGVQFTPNGINDYTTAFVDFIPIISTSNLLWSTTDSTLIGIGSSLNWDPNSSNNLVDTLIVGSPSFLSTFTDSIFLITNPGLEITLPGGTPCNFDSVILGYNLDYADSVLWSTGETTPTIQITGNGLYEITAYIDGCSYDRGLNILFDQSDFDIGDDSVLCEGDSILLGDFYVGANYTWQDGSHDTYLKVKESGTYYVNMILGGCQYKDTVELSFTEAPRFPGDTMVCDGDPFDLVIEYENASFLWHDGSTDSTFTVNQTGMYSVEVTKDNCIWSHNMGVIFVDSISIDFGPDTAICVGDTFSIGENILSANYLWQDGSTAVKYYVETTGLYHCEITVGNCTVSDSIFVQVDSTPEIDLGGEFIICDGDTIQLDAFIPGATYIWNDGSTDTTLAVHGAGLYSVEVKLNNCYYWDTVLVSNVSLSVLNLGPDTVILCQGEAINLEAGVDNAIAYLWQDGSGGSGYVVTQPGLYHAEVFFNGCSISDTIYVEGATTPAINLGQDLTICYGDTVFLDAGYPGASYSWQNGSSNSTFSAHQSGTYIVDVTLGNCVYSDTMELTVKPISSFDLGPDQTICANDFLVLGGFTPGASYLWNNGSNLSYQNVNQTGLYILEVDLNGCVKTDSVYITVIPIPSFNLGPDTILCTGETMTLNATFPGATDYTWQDGTSSPTYFVNESGIYSAIIQLDGCTYKDQINVLIVDSINVELPDTVSFCHGESFELNATYLDSGTTYQWNDGDTSAFHAVTEPGLSSVIVRLGNCILYDSTFVIVHALPELNLIDTNICYGDQITYNAYTPDAQSYLWQDGSQGSSITASKEGWYTVTVQNEHCDSRDSAYLSLTYEPEIYLPEDTFLCEDNSILFNFPDTNYRYLWQNDTMTSEFEITEPGIYNLQVINKCGISNSTIAITREQCLCTMFIPNSFSPNGDINNQLFETFPECDLSLYDMKIFNRWGKMVFSTEDPQEFWNGSFKGETLGQESYVYKIEYAFVNESIVHKETGTIVLIQ